MFIHWGTISTTIDKFLLQKITEYLPHQQNQNSWRFKAFLLLFSIAIAYLWMCKCRYWKHEWWWCLSHKERQPIHIMNRASSDKIPVEGMCVRVCALRIKMRHWHLVTFFTVLTVSTTVRHKKTHLLTNRSIFLKSKMAPPLFSIGTLKKHPAVSIDFVNVSHKLCIFINLILFKIFIWWIITKFIIVNSVHRIHLHNHMDGIHNTFNYDILFKVLFIFI